MNRRYEVQYLEPHQLDWKLWDNGPCWTARDAVERLGYLKQSFPDYQFRLRLYRDISLAGLSEETA